VLSCMQSCSSSRKGFNGMCRITRCKGSLYCILECCPYKMNTVDRINFISIWKWASWFVSSALAFQKCPDIKVREYDQQAEEAIVYHDGVHTYTGHFYYPVTYHYQHRLGRPTTAILVIWWLSRFLTEHQHHLGYLVPLFSGTIKEM